MALCTLAWLAACASSSVPMGGADGESHFLAHCAGDCEDGLACQGSVCTLPCDEPEACRALSPLASCVGLVADGDEPSTEPRCDVPCAGGADCQGLGEDFVCADGLCRRVPADRPVNREAGEPCEHSRQCASGVCQGMGCGEDFLGVCQGTQGVVCTDDAVMYCGCDGVTFVESGSCPGRRYAQRGGCDCREPGRYQAGKEGSYLPCCAGLTEVSWLAPASRDGEPVCIEPPGHREYGCVAGSCGDGTCEVGEDGACGCEADCPGAVLMMPDGR